MSGWDDYELAKFFPKLVLFGVMWKEINWEYSEDSFFTNNHISIRNVAGFSNDGSFRKYINDLYLNEVLLLRNTLGKMIKEKQLKLLENLIGESEDFKSMVVSEFPFEGKHYKQFIRSQLMELNQNSIRVEPISEELVLCESEAYPIAFLKSVDELTNKLLYLKAEIELKNEEDSDPLSFEYIGWKSQPDDLNNLYDALCKAEFILQERNSVVDFKRIFSGKVVRERIVWEKDNQDLYWFISCLKRANALLRPSKCWIKACHCFKKKVNDQLGNDYFEINELSKSHKPHDSLKVELIKTIVTGNLKLGNGKK